MRKNIPIPYKSVWKHIWHGGGQGDPMADGASGSQGGHGLRLADLCESGGPKQPHSETMISLELDPGVWTCIAASSHGKPARRTGLEPLLTWPLRPGKEFAVSWSLMQG